VKCRKNYTQEQQDKKQHKRELKHQETTTKAGMPTADKLTTAGTPETLETQTASGTSTR
jgi:hypothetical protein